MVNIVRLTVAYQNATINVKPETQNRRLEPTGLAKPRETRGLMGTGPGLARQESAGRVFARFWNRTNPFLRSKPGPLAGYPDPLLTLSMSALNLDFQSSSMSTRNSCPTVGITKCSDASRSGVNLILLHTLRTCVSLK
jgi:hypothetical protein